MKEELSGYEPNFREWRTEEIIEYEQWQRKKEARCAGVIEVPPIANLGIIDGIRYLYKSIKDFYYRPKN